MPGKSNAQQNEPQFAGLNVNANYQPFPMPIVHLPYGCVQLQLVGNQLLV